MQLGGGIGKGEVMLETLERETQKPKLRTSLKGII